jgi:hypothetical protein
MGLSATEVTPTIKLIIWFIFMSSRSLTPCLATIARPQDFTVSPMDCSAISPSGEKREPLPAREDVVHCVSLFVCD